MNAASILKKEIRKKVLAERRQLKIEDWLSRSEAIRQNLLNSSFYEEARTIHCFVSINERKEVNTHPLVAKIIKDGKKVAVPVTDFEAGSLKHALISDTETMKPNKWGIPEPVEYTEARLEDIDLVLVPMAAADVYGNRLGYGKGFYDRFLQQVQAVKAGLIFSEFILDEIPAENFDVKMDILITEKSIIRCNNRASLA